MFNPTPAMAGWFGYPLELNDRLRLIRDAGFQSVLLWWAVESKYEPSVPEKVETAAKYGLSVENAHLQFADMNAIWQDGYDGEHYLAELAGLVAEAGVYGVPTLVVHLTRRKDPPPFSDLGFSRFLRLCDVVAQANEFVFPICLMVEIVLLGSKIGVIPVLIVLNLLEVFLKNLETSLEFDHPFGVDSFFRESLSKRCINLRLA